MQGVAGSSPAGRTNLPFLRLSMNSYLFLVLFLTTPVLWAQISVGLKESAMGNSGAAITDSSAAAFYNPALLSEKTESHFSLTGTTLASFQSKEFRSNKLTPNYISSIQAFEAYVHEFSLSNQLSVESQSAVPVLDGTQTMNLRIDQYILAYSMAFRNFPFGFQVGLRMNEQKYQINQTTENVNEAKGSNINISQTRADLFLGFGGIHQLGSHYRFGYKYESAGLNVYKKIETDGTYYLYNKIGNTFTTGKSSGSASDDQMNKQIVTLGHSFTWNAHEFLTDSRFVESAQGSNAYSFYQTFGYKVTYSNQMQYMCGVAHQFKSDLSDLQESNQFSTGFSWVTNTLRSSISAYYFTQNGDDGLQSAGITFGSEFKF